MSLQILPSVIEDLIYDYRNQFELTEKYNRVIADLEFKIEAMYYHDENDNTTNWGYTSYRLARAFYTDVLIVELNYIPKCLIVEEQCFYNIDIINEIIDEMMEDEYFPIYNDIDDVNEYFGYGNNNDIDDEDVNDDIIEEDFIPVYDIDDVSEDWEYDGQ